MLHECEFCSKSQMSEQSFVSNEEWLSLESAYDIGFLY
jgi:hypothetical protein